MKFLRILAIVALCVSCDKKEIEEPSTFVTIQFSHNWNGTAVSKTDFNTVKFVNAHGTTLSIERFRYLVSNVILTNTENQSIKIKGHNLVDIGEESGLSFQSDSAIPQGNYKLSFTFGFNDTDNTDAAYQDLNSVSFNVPGMLGGGYHFMQFDGKYAVTNSTPANFNYHVIRAVNRADPANLVFQDTSFKVDLGTVTIKNNAIVAIKMNISEWFKNPNTWDLNVLNTVLMPNFNAQLLMSANGKSVFSLGTVTP